MPDLCLCYSQGMALEQRHSRRFHVTLTPGEDDALAALADQRGTSKAVLARSAIRKMLGMPTLGELEVQTQEKEGKE